MADKRQRHHEDKTVDEHDEGITIMQDSPAHSEAHRRPIVTRAHVTRYILYYKLEILLLFWSYEIPTCW